MPGRWWRKGACATSSTTPHTPIPASFWSANPGRIVEETRNLPTIPGEIPDLIDLPVGCIFKNRCPAAFEPCDRERPRWTEVADGHFSLCHLAERGG